MIENTLAETRKNQLELLLGKPNIVTNQQGTECDRHWKILYSGVQLTLHLYSNPKNKKGSKLLLQGGSQSLLCSYVFDELPNIYKLVCENKPLSLRMKPRSKRDVASNLVKCIQCKFKSSLAQMSKHMSSEHSNGPKVKRAVKRLYNFTPALAAAKRSKNVLTNTEGVFDVGESFLLDGSYNDEVVLLEENVPTNDQVEPLVNIPPDKPQPCNNSSDNNAQPSSNNSCVKCQVNFDALFV